MSSKRNDEEEKRSGKAMAAIVKQARSLFRHQGLLRRQQLAMKKLWQ